MIGSVVSTSLGWGNPVARKRYRFVWKHSRIELFKNREGGNFSPHQINVLRIEVALLLYAKPRDLSSKCKSINYSSFITVKNSTGLLIFFSFFYQHFHDVCVYVIGEGEQAGGTCKCEQKRNIRFRCSTQVTSL